MSEFVNRVQTNIKKSSQDLMHFSLRMISGGLMGLTISLIVQEFLGKPQNEVNLSFIFVLSVVLLAFMRLSKTWTMTAIFIFNLIFILIGMILRLYITTAPGA